MNEAGSIGVGFSCTVLDASDSRFVSVKFFTIFVDDCCGGGGGAGRV